MVLMGWQELIAGCIVVYALWRLVRGIYRTLRPTETPTSPCSSCPTPCQLKEMVAPKNKAKGFSTPNCPDETKKMER